KSLSRPTARPLPPPARIKPSGCGILRPAKSFASSRATAGPCERWRFHRMENTWRPPGRMPQPLFGISRKNRGNQRSAAAGPAGPTVRRLTMNNFDRYHVFATFGLFFATACAFAAEPSAPSKKTYTYKTVDGFAIQADVYRPDDTKI